MWIIAAAMDGAVSPSVAIEMGLSIPLIVGNVVTYEACLQAPGHHRVGGRRPRDGVDEPGRRHRVGLVQGAGRIFSPLNPVGTPAHRHLLRHAGRGLPSGSPAGGRRAHVSLRGGRGQQDLRGH
jgi:hypothetical protein